MKDELTYEELIEKYNEARQIIISKEKEILELKESSALFEKDQTFNKTISLFADLLPLVVTLIDLDGKFIYLNQFGLDLLGFTSSDISNGLHVKNILVNAKDYNSFIKRVQSPYDKAGIPSGNEHLIKSKNGKQFYVLVFSQIIVIPKTGSTVLGVFVNHTKYRKECEEQILVEQKLRDINNAKDKFFSIIAHDLKSPFNAILGFADLVLSDIEKIPREQVRNYISIVHKSATNGLNLLENLLSWSLNQTNKIEFKRTSFDLTELLLENIDFVEEKAAIKGIVIDCNCDEGILVKADKNMIDTVLRNLLSNAVKFTRANGKVIVTVKLFKQEGNENHKKVQVTVADNGIGIEERDIKKLFKIDSQFSTQGTSFEQGTGLGLVLCSDFIDRHDGKIWVDSVVGQGSQFHFTIPIESKE